MTNKTILSICIPTYNRAVYLNRLLKSISNLRKDLVHIEVCVSNNNSSDNTKYIVQKWSKSYAIKYNENDENLGAIKNYFISLSMATSQYIWVLGDDDSIIPQNVSHFLRLLFSQAPEYDWYFVGSRNTKKEDQFCYHEFSKYENKSFDLFRYLIKQDISYLGFLGHHVFKRNLIGEEYNSKKHVYNSYPHVTLLMSKEFNINVKSYFMSIKAGDLEWDTFTYYFVVMSYIFSFENSFFSPLGKALLTFNYFFFNKNSLKYLLLSTLSPNYSVVEMNKRFDKLTISSRKFDTKFYLNVHRVIMYLFYLLPLPKTLKRNLLNYNLYKINNEDLEGYKRGL